MYSNSSLAQTYLKKKTTDCGRVKSFTFKGSYTSAVNLQLGISQKVENLFTLPL